ncbi:RHS repeat-associated core domain-containing protein [Desulfosporosinus meridiei]|uniref:RHS repeat-associated core domain-containing protein n=1 Tax=Desulfosporosinus meridiei TaxID=79209 RepID=UPI0002313AB1|nr:RHS repeat-associated core domain-containing protein [Desulfosporosinus meridiei]
MTNASGTTFYYVTNFRGDVIRIMDGNGNSVASYSYDPWGKVLSVTENAAVAGQPIRYASYAYDTETQLYYLQARYYDPETARFISRDPDGGDQDNPISQNLYAYANDDPVNNVDPDGQWAWLIGAAVSATISGALYGLEVRNGLRDFSGRDLAITMGTAALMGGLSAGVFGNSLKFQDYLNIINLVFWSQ